MEWYLRMSKTTLCGPWENRTSTGRQGSTAPATKAAALSQRLPARLLSHIQTSNTGEVAAVNKLEHAAAPANMPASALIPAFGRPVAATAARNAATTRTRQSA